MTRDQYVEINRKMWELTGRIYKSYGFKEALQQVKESSFSTLDAIERDLFQSSYDLVGKSVIQVGCNNGLELISIKRQGAGRCVGVDVSQQFIDQAKELAAVAATSIEFETINIYDISKKYYNQFDLVYITVGVLGWMPDILQLFKIINRLLKTGGHIFVYEQHPILNMLNPKPPHLIDASYFQRHPFKDEILPEYIQGTGAKKETSYWFPYTLENILMAAIKTNFEISQFREHPTDISDTYKLLANNKAQLPLSFTLLAKKSKKPV